MKSYYVLFYYSNCTINGVFMGTGMRGDEFYNESHEIIGVLKVCYVNVFLYYFQYFMIIL